MFRTHCTDDQLLAHLDGELSRRVSRRVGRHLQQCWECRARQGELETSARVLSAAAAAAVTNQDSDCEPMPWTLSAGGAAIPHPVSELMPRAHAAGGGRRLDIDGARRRFAASRHQFERARTAAGQPRLARWRPALAAIGAGLAVVAIILIVQFSQPPLSAAELIGRSSAAERALVADPQQVVHRSLRFEARRLPQGTVMDRRRLDIWQQGGARGVMVRRAFDDANHGIGDTPVAAAAAAAAAGGPAREGWRVELSSDAFTAITSHAPSASLRLTAESGDGATYAIAYAPDPEPRDGVIRAMLRVRRSDLRAVEMMFVVRAGDAMTEYRVHEESFARVPAAEVVDVLTSAPTPVSAPAPPPAPHVASTPTTASRTRASDAALDRLELDAWYQLHRLDRCVTGLPELSRLDARVHITVQPADDACRQRIADAFATLGHTNAIRLNLAPRPTPGPTPTPASSLAPPSSTHRAEAPRPAAASRARAETPAAAEAMFADWTINRSADALRHAIALKRLIDRWPPASIRAFDPDAAANWQNMVRRDARAVGDEIKTLRTHLQPIYFAGLNADDTLPPIEPLRSADDVPAAVERLLAAVRASDEAVRRVFASASARDGQPPLSPEHSPRDGRAAQPPLSQDQLNAPGRALADGRTPVSRAQLDALGRALREVERLAAGFDEPWPLPQ
jgi:hypothetical protein